MAGKTRLRASQSVEDTIEDKDGDTKVSVEESTDEDKIRFDTGGTERMIIDDAGQIGINTSDPAYLVDIKTNNGGIRLGNTTNSGEKSSNIHFTELADSSGLNAYGFSLNYNATDNAFNVKRHNNNTSGVSMMNFSRAFGNIQMGDVDPSRFGGTGVPKLWVNADVSDRGIIRCSQHTADSDPPQFEISKARGTIESPAAVQSLDYIAQLRAMGHDGTDFQISSDLLWIASDDFTSTSRPSTLTIRTVASGSTTPAERMRITHDGKIGMGTTSPTSILTLNGTQPSLTFRESDSDRAEILINDSDNLVITNQSTNKYIVLKTNDAGTVREGLRIGGVTPEVVVNEGSDSLVDFRVESDNNTHMLFVDGGNDRIGIGTSSPSVMLDMVGESAGETQIRLEQNNTDADAPDMRFFKSRGTTASKTAVADNDNLAFVNSFAYDGANYQQAGAFGWNADGTDGDSTFSLKTRVAGTTADRLTVDAVGNLAVPGDLFVSGTMRTTNDISFQDNGGTFPTNTAGFFWDLNNDEARIYAKQPSSDAIDFVFKLSDNNHSQDRYIFWIDDYRGSSYDRYPLSLRGDGVFFNMVHSSEGVPNFTTAKARIDSEGRLALRTSSDPSTLNDNAHIYSKNISGHAEMFVRDSQGNVTQISPHNDEGEWEYFSKNTTTGKVVRINMEKMIRRLESITGESFIQEWYEDV